MSTTTGAGGGGFPRIEHGNVTVKRCRHGFMMFPKHDAYIGRSLDLYGQWAESELRLLSLFLDEGSVAIDVGANVGTHAVFFAGAVGPSGIVLAFEPQRAIFQMLCGNVALNGHTNVTCFEAAAGARPGLLEIDALSPDQATNFGGASGSARKERRPTTTVECIAIDSLELPRCDVIKVDVEGMEVDVLRGAEKTIARTRPALFVENNTVEGSRALLAEVARLDYRAYWHFAPYFDRRNFEERSENVFEAVRPEANILCVPRDVEVDGMPAAREDEDWMAAIARLSRNA